jgi:tripartite-type tricarboxylate transporter receptor subunit TctC
MRTMLRAIVSAVSGPSGSAGCNGRPPISRHNCRGLFVAAFLGTALTPAQAQNYPTQPIKIVIGAPTGTSADLTGRVIASKWSERLGKLVVVENRPGQSGIAAAEAVARAAPDGYTLLVAPFGMLVVNPAVNAQLPYDAQKSFTPIGLIADFPLFLVVNNDVPAKTVQQLIAWTKSNPARSTYGSTSPLYQVASEMFKSRTGAIGEHVPFKGSSVEIVTGVVAGRISWAFVDPAPLIGPLKAGKLKAIAGSGSKRYPDLPEVPTLKEAGIDGVVVDAFTALVAPSGTPMPIIKKLEGELNAILKSRDVVGRFDLLSINPAIATSEEASAMLARVIPVWKKVAQKAAIKAE